MVKAIGNDGVKVTLEKIVKEAKSVPVEERVKAVKEVAERDAKLVSEIPSENLRANLYTPRLDPPILRRFK